MTAIAAGVDFLDAPLAVFGALLVLGALVSGLAQRSFLSLTAGFVLAGLLLGQAGFGALDFDPTSQFVQGLAVVALILILFFHPPKETKKPEPAPEPELAGV